MVLIDNIASRRRPKKKKKKLLLWHKEEAGLSRQASTQVGKLKLATGRGSWRVGDEGGGGFGSRTMRQHGELPGELKPTPAGTESTV